MQKKHYLSLVGVLGASALLIAGCSSGDSGGDKDDNSSNDGDAKDWTLNFTSYGSAYQEAQNEAFTTPWAEENGAKVNNDEPTSYAKIQQMVDAGDVMWDVVDTEPYYPVSVCGEYVEKLDMSNINVDDFPEGTVSDCSIPLAQYSTIVVFNDGSYPDAKPSTVEDFFDVEKFPGTRMVPNWAGGGALEFALIADGVAPADLYPLDVERAFAKLDTIRDSLTFWNTSAESQQAMEDGSQDMLLAWSGRAYEAEKNGGTITPVWDNNLLAWASFSIPKGAKNKEAAQNFIEYAAGAEPQARFAEIQPYSPANLNAKPELDELQQKYNVASEEVQNQAVITNVQWWADNVTEAEEAWTNWSTS